MANRDSSRRVPPATTRGDLPPKRRDSRPSLPHAGAGAFLSSVTLIDLDRHPDGELMRLCSRAAALQDRAALEGVDVNYWPMPPFVCTLIGLEGEIAVTEASTIEGARLKAMTLIGDEDSALNRTFGRFGLVAVIRDFLRLGVR